MAVNKVQKRGGEVIIDISDSTVASSHLENGYTAYDKTGSKITGSLSVITYYTGSSTPSASLGSNGDIYLKVVS